MNTGIDNKTRVLKIISLLEKEFPDAKITLNYSNPLELLIATILSAQCTDERVNLVTKTLFKRYRTARDYANADTKELEQNIRARAMSVITNHYNVESSCICSVGDG